MCIYLNRLRKDEDAYEDYACECFYHYITTSLNPAPPLRHWVTVTATLFRGLFAALAPRRMGTRRSKSGFERWWKPVEYVRQYVTAWTLEGLRCGSDRLYRLCYYYTATIVMYASVRIANYIVHFNRVSRYWRQRARARVEFSVSLTRAKSHSDNNCAPDNSASARRVSWIEETDEVLFFNVRNDTEKDASTATLPR